MLNLVFETSTPRASLAAIGPDGEVMLREFTGDRSHNSALFHPLRELLGGDSAVGLVLVGSGPGSYSGTRVGIAAAQGVAIAVSCPAVAVPSILAVAPAAEGAACLAIGDARRGSYWVANMEGYRLHQAPELTDAEGLEKRVAKAISNGMTVFSFEEQNRFPISNELKAQILMEFPDAAKLWNVWTATDDATKHQWMLQPPQPMYLRPPHITPAKNGRTFKPLPSLPDGDQ